ncbi:hypothetical protein SISNIDRAFT_455118 [Sistotremastrum niveocremeum HHB9708]|uniref:Uncharacterized protein n=1 Tax=Sistotremastrum niveocremeum HHB9708 TaxID=1314777 RepID=A0A164UDY9_9AGAM|nr:hypothetical protein SISNIDRAFT_455118 [Sistotremastrum niveocremeum HHB9708]
MFKRHIRIVRSREVVATSPGSLGCTTMDVISNSTVSDQSTSTNLGHYIPDV